MKPNVRLAALLLLAAPALALGLPPLGSRVPVQEEHGEEEESVMLASMDVLNGAMRNLRRRVKDPERRAECLELIHEMQDAVVTAKREIPPIALKQEGDERARMVTGYRRMMAEVLAGTAQLEIAVLDGDAEAASEVLRKLNEMKSDGHEVFQEEEE